MPANRLRHHAARNFLGVLRVAGRPVVRLTANFERDLADIERFLSESEAPGAYDALLDDLLVLYLEVDASLYLLAIRHHRQISFYFQSHWSGQSAGLE
jgi:hypothetical protein